MSAEDDRMRFAKELRRCSQALMSTTAGAHLRKLQRFAQGMLFSTSDGRMRTLGFMVDQWVKDYYLNFAGDVVSPHWEGIELIRKELLRQKTSHALDLLATAVAEGTDPTEAFEELITSYLDAITAANLELEQVL
jgi:hypothetical protein